VTTYHLTKISTNTKVGPIPTVVISNETCPPACPYMNDGCYADLGPLGMHWRKVTDGNRGGSFKELLAAIKEFPAKQIWR